MRIKTIIFLFFILLVSDGTMRAQEKVPTITGCVTNANGNGIRGVVCKLKNAKDSLMAYSLTDNRGRYSFSMHNGATMIEFSHLSYEKETKEIKEGIFNYDVTLNAKAIQLKEVTVTVSPIRRSNDTLVYNTASFQKKEDVNIEDVLRRLPGIEVSSAGEITYQGKSINKLNIEGLDLMGDRYNQATKSMPADAVSQIQVMENNQPVRVLEGMINNNHATINIKLKKDHKLRPFGEIEGGGGNDVWAGSATTIKINPKNQWLVTGTLDNRGISLSSLTKEMANYDRMYTIEPLPHSVLSNDTYGVPPISPIYYLKNKSYFMGINYLHAFSKYSTFRINLLYNHEDVSRTDSTFNQYFSNDTVSIYQNESLYSHKDDIKAQARYELNSNKIYIEDILTGEGSWYKSDGLYNNESDCIEERVASKPAFLQNTLNSHFGVGNQILTLSSVVRAYRSNETLHFQYAGEDDINTQKTKTLSLFTRNRIGSSFKLFGNTLGLAFILEHKRNDLRNVLATDNNKSHYWLETIETSYSVNLGNGELSINIPIEYINYNIMSKRFNRFLFAPSADFNLRISNTLTGSLNVGYNQDPNTESIMHKGVLYNNYRTFSVGIDSLSVQNSSVANLRLSYLNTSSLFSMNMFVGWSRQKRDYLPDYIYTNAFTLVRPKWEDNTATTVSAAFNMKKIFRSIGLSMKYSAQYADNSQMASQNDFEGKIRNHALSTTFSTEWSKLDYFHLTGIVGSNMRWKQRDIFSDSHNFLNDYEYTLKMDIFPTNKIQIYADYSQIFHEITNGNYVKANFINTGLKYKIWKKVFVKFSVVNLLNTKSYKESSYNGVNYSYYDIPLRGREMLLSLNLRF